MLMWEHSFHLRILKMLPVMRWWKSQHSFHWTSQLKSDCSQFLCKYKCCASSMFVRVSKSNVASCINNTSKPSTCAYWLHFYLSLVNRTRCRCCKSSESQLSQLIWSQLASADDGSVDFIVTLSQIYTGCCSSTPPLPAGPPPLSDSVHVLLSERHESKFHQRLRLWAS